MPTENPPRPQIIVVDHDPGTELGHVLDGTQMPAIVAAAGDGARFAWEEFIYGTISNEHTRAAYLHNIRSFLSVA